MSSLSIFEVIEKFGDDAKAEEWFAARRWPDGIACIYCGSLNVGQHKNARRSTRQFYCNDCESRFTIKTGTIMHNSKLPLRKWAIAYYLLPATAGESPAFVSGTPVKAWQSGRERRLTSSESPGPFERQWRAVPTAVCGRLCRRSPTGRRQYGQRTPERRWQAQFRPVGPRLPK